MHGGGAEAREAAPGVGDGQHQEPYPRIFGGQDHGLRQDVRVSVRCSVRTMVNVVKLGDASVSRGEHLLEATAAGFAYGVGRQSLRQSIHPLAPGPEVVVGAGGFDPLYSTSQPSLEGVAVIVDEAGGERLTG